MTCGPAYDALACLHFVTGCPLDTLSRKTGQWLCLQDFYTGTMYTFYNKWASGRKTMRDSGFVLREVEAAAKKKPSAMLAAVAMPLVPLPL